MAVVTESWNQSLLFAGLHLEEDWGGSRRGLRSENSWQFCINMAETKKCLEIFASFAKTKKTVVTKFFPTPNPRIWNHCIETSSCDHCVVLLCTIFVITISSEAKTQSLQMEIISQLMCSSTPVFSLILYFFHVGLAWSCLQQLFCINCTVNF